ncbi:MAG TPA: TolC family protein [Burkholderiales bacterium]|nr:TolC family protein [Burkholderiales bacterium]
MSRLHAQLASATLIGLALAQPLGALGQSVDLTALTLMRAEELLQAHNRELQAARRTVEAAGANTISAGARPNPTLSFGVSTINPKEGIGSGPLRDKIVDSSVRIDQIIERGDRRELRLANARSLESASTEDLSDTQRQQRLALRYAYYDLLFAQDKVDIARDTIALFEGSVRAAELRLKAGDIAMADVARLRVDALRARNDARAAEADQRRAQLALAYMIGAEGRAIGIRAADPWPSIYSGRSGGSVDELIEGRPDVRAARKRFEAAQSARELARSLRTRDVSVGASYDHYPVNPSYAQGSGAGTGNSFGVFLSVPIFTGYYYEGEIRRSEVDYDTAMEALDRVRAQARTEIARSFSDLQAAAERLQRYDESLLIEARRAADSAEFAYKNGAIGVMDLLDARRTLRAIQIDAASARNDHAKALSAWQAGIGRLDDESK